MSTGWGDPNDPVRKWKEDADRQEEERRAAKRELRQCEEHNMVAHLRADMEHEIAALRSELDAQKTLILDAVGQALGDISNKMCERFEASINKLEGDVRRSFGEAMGRSDALAPDVRSRAKDFKFSNERDDGVVDLPNPLAPVMRKVTVN